MQRSLKEHNIQEFKIYTEILKLHLSYVNMIERRGTRTFQDIKGWIDVFLKICI